MTCILKMDVTYLGWHLTILVSGTWQVLNNFCVELKIRPTVQRTCSLSSFPDWKRHPLFDQCYINVQNSCPWPQNRAKPRSSHWDQSHGHWPCAVTAVLAPDGVNNPSWKRQGPVKENMTPSPWCCSFEILSWCEICPLMLSLLLWPCLWSFPQAWWSRFWCILGYVLQAQVLCSLCSFPFSSSFFLLCFLLPLISYSYFYFFSPLVSVTSLLTP